MGRKKTYEDNLLPIKIEDIKQISKNNFIQSNALIQSVFSQPFKEIELRTLCLISKYVNENNFIQNTENLIKITIPKKDFCKSLDTNQNDFHHQINILAKELTNKKIKIEELQNRKNFITLVLFPAIECKDGSVTFYMSPFLQPYLQHLKSNFTKMSLDYINRIGSSHSIKIYKLLKQYENLGERTFKIQEFKEMLGIENLYRNNFNNLDKKVLSVAKKNINQTTDLQISVKKNKVGKKIESFTFSIKPKKNQFQQAIQIFTKEIDQLMKQKLLDYATIHKNIQKNWYESKKKIEKNEELFDYWIQNRTLSYDPQSIHQINISKLIELSINQQTPQWYEEFLIKKQKERYRSV